MKERNTIMYIEITKKTQEEIQKKEEEISELLNNLTDEFKIEFEKLPELGSMRMNGSDKLLKDNIIEAIHYFLREKNPETVNGFIEIEKQKAGTKIETKEIVKKLNPTLEKIGFIAKENKEFINGAIDIELMQA